MKILALVVGLTLGIGAVVSTPVESSTTAADINLNSIPTVTGNATRAKRNVAPETTTSLPNETATPADPHHGIREKREGQNQTATVTTTTTTNSTTNGTETAEHGTSIREARDKRDTETVGEPLFDVDSYRSTDNLLYYKVSEKMYKSYRQNTMKKENIESCSGP